MKTIDEEHVAQRLRQQLDAGSHQLDSNIKERLLKSRQLALARHDAKWSHAIQRNSASTLVSIPHKAKLALAAIAFSIGITSTYYWNSSEESILIEEIDSALLADDIPPSAYIDQGFRKWLEQASQSSVLQ